MMRQLYPRVSKYFHKMQFVLFFFNYTEVQWNLHILILTDVRDFIMDCLKPNPEERPSLTSLLSYSFLSDEINQGTAETHSKLSEVSQSTEPSTIPLSPEDQSFETDRAVHSKTSTIPKDYTSGEIILEEIYEECEDFTESLTNFDQTADNKVSHKCKRKRYIIDDNFDCDSISQYKITRNH